MIFCNAYICPDGPRADPFRRSPAELDAENHDALAQIRSNTGNANVLRELWTFSKYGTLRFFRVKDPRLLETGRAGRPLAVPEAKPAVEKR